MNSSAQCPQCFVLQKSLIQVGQWTTLHRGRHTTTKRWIFFLLRTKNTKHICCSTAGAYIILDTSAFGRRKSDYRVINRGVVGWAELTWERKCCWASVLEITQRYRLKGFTDDGTFKFLVKTMSSTFVVVICVRT